MDVSLGIKSKTKKHEKIDFCVMGGPAGLFRDVEFNTFWDGILGCKIAGNGMRYTHGTGNFLIFLFGKQDRYEMIVWCRDK